VTKIAKTLAKTVYMSLDLVFEETISQYNLLTSKVTAAGNTKKIIT